MRAIILAAGQGTRLVPYTLDKPKCLVELAGKSLLARQYEVLKDLGIDETVVVAGYRNDCISDKGFPTVLNPDFASTNMVSSLMCGRHFLDGTDDVLILYGDIVFETRVLKQIIDSTADIAVGANSEWLKLWTARMEDPLSDAETLKVDAANRISEIGGKAKSLQEIEGQYMGMIKLSKQATPKVTGLFEDLTASSKMSESELANMYMTDFIQAMIDRGDPVTAVHVDGGWLEVDTSEDLELYESLWQQGALNQFCKLANN
jgi:choline kinase